MIELNVAKLYQWDQGVEVSGFTGNAVQFANQGDSQAVTILLDGEKRKRIPDRYLTSGKAVKVYDVTVSENSDVTETHSVTIFPVVAKPKPKNYVPTEAEQAFSLVENLVNEAKEAAKSAGNLAQDALGYAEDAYHEASNANASAGRAEIAAARAENAADKLQQLVVETENDTFGASHSASDIFAAASAGKDVILKWVWDDADPVYIPLATAAPQVAVFVEYSKDTETIYTVDTDGFIGDTTLPLSSLAVLDDTKNGAKNTWSAKKISELLDGKASIDNNTVGSDAWSSRNIVERLCPPLSLSGKLLSFVPMAGYPLTVTSQPEGTYIHVCLCGKNLYDKVTYPLNIEGYVNRSNGKFSTSNTYRRTDYIPVAHLVGQRITLNFAPVNAANPGMAFYDAQKNYISGGAGNNILVPATAVYMIFSVAVGNASKDVQLELGSAATDYEPYWFREEEGEEVILIGRTGYHTLYAEGEDGILEAVVSGRADPVAIIEKLTSAVLSLGSNI